GLGQISGAVLIEALLALRGARRGRRKAGREGAWRRRHSLGRRHGWGEGAGRGRRDEWCLSQGWCDGRRRRTSGGIVAAIFLKLLIDISGTDRNAFLLRVLLDNDVVFHLVQHVAAKHTRLAQVLVHLGKWAALHTQQLLNILGVNS